MEDWDEEQDDLHGACKYGHYDRLCRIVESGLDPRVVTFSSSDHATPLHVTSWNDHLRVTAYLVETCHCDVNSTNRWKETPLHLACQRGHMSMVQYLVRSHGCNINITSSYGLTPFHYACLNRHWTVVAYLVKSPQFDPMTCVYQTSDCATPIHYFYEYRQEEIVECLIKHPRFDPKRYDESISGSESLLHLACRKGWLSIAKILIEEKNVSLSRKNSIGETVLHEACRNRNDVVLRFLVQFKRIDINCTTSAGQTPLDLVQSPIHIRLLLEHGATPTYKLYNKYFPHHLRKTPTDMSIKMFILGNPGAGKSTLVESLKANRDGFFRFLNWFTKVRNVNERTVGIIPHDLTCKLLGKVSLYDFAGHEEFHAGHGVLLSNSMANSPSIVMLVVDVSDEKENLIRAVLYWLEFINNQCSEEGPKPHLVLVCSHADQSKDVASKVQVAVSLIDSSRFNYVGQITIDCRYAESSSMSELRAILAQSCQELRSLRAIAVEHHCFLVFLLDKLKYVTAITLDKTKLMIKDEAYFKFLKSLNLLEICEQLNQRGDILFMKNRQNPDNSWIVLDKATLLARVNGILFAPEGFKEHQRIATSTGVVPLSKLTSLFPDLDSDMIVQFLCHLEFCHEIADSKLLDLLPADEIRCQMESNERFYFFPGLVRDIMLSRDLWLPNDDLSFHYGWAIQCSKSKQFLTPRFIQVLLLRLAFSFALAPSSEALIINHPALQRRCKIWKNGIFWANTFGGEAIVEINNQRQVAVITRCRKEHELESGRLLSSVIHKVLEVKNEHCPNITLTESVVLSNDAAQYSYPLELTKMTTISIVDVAQNIEKNATYFVLDDQHNIHVENFFYFEPYINIGEQTLKTLLDEDTVQHHQVITNEFIRHVAKQMRSKSNYYIALLNEELTPISGNILQELQAWKNDKGSQATYCNLHKQLDKFSVFAGRNPMKVAAGETSLLEHQCSASKPTVTAPTKVNIIASVSPKSQPDGEQVNFDIEKFQTAKSIINKEDKELEDEICAHLKGSERPTLRQLQSLSGRGGKKMRVMREVTPNWKDLAIALGFDIPGIEIIDQTALRRPEDACRDMLGRWLDGDSDLVEVTWNVLIQSLTDAGLVEVADDLKECLSL